MLRRYSFSLPCLSNVLLGTHSGLWWEFYCRFPATSFLISMSASCLWIASWYDNGRCPPYSVFTDVLTIHLYAIKFSHELVRRAFSSYSELELPELIRGSAPFINHQWHNPVFIDFHLRSACPGPWTKLYTSFAGHFAVCAALGVVDT